MSTSLLKPCAETQNLETEMGAVEGALLAHQQGLQRHKDTVNQFVAEMDDCDRLLAEIEPQRAERSVALEGVLEQRHAADRQAKHWRSMQEKQLAKLDSVRADLALKQQEAKVRALSSARRAGKIKLTSRIGPTPHANSARRGSKDHGQSRSWKPSTRLRQRLCKRRKIGE